MARPSNHDELSLLIRNFPNDFTEQDVREFLSLFDPAEVFVAVATRTALARFPSGDHAKDVLIVVHQANVNGKLLYVEYAQKSASKLFPMVSPFENATGDDSCSNCTPADKTTANIHRFHDAAKYPNFSQPIPPHLKYQYPLVNRDIIAAINVSLENSSKFYVQVLHLMNRMNLEPPFTFGAKGLLYANTCNEVPSLKHVDIGVQTDGYIWEQMVKNKRKFLASDESEMETDSSDGTELETTQDRSTGKRPKLQEDSRIKLKQKVQKVLKNHQLVEDNLNDKKAAVKDIANQGINNVFDLSFAVDKPLGIKIVAPSAVPVIPMEHALPENATDALSIDDTNQSQPAIVPNEPSITTPQTDAKPADEDARNAINLMPDAELKENRIPADKLASHPLFQNYSPGDVSNKLYIKNIAKEVTVDELKSVFHRYLEENAGKESNVRAIDIRLMTSGRMKGQAFITFTGPYMEDDEVPADEKYRMVEKARRETNGLILKSKAIVVTFGKVNK